MEELISRFVDLWEQIIASGEDVELNFWNPDADLKITTPVEIIWNDKENDTCIGWNPTDYETQQKNKIKKDFRVDFSGYLKIKAKDADEAKQKAWDCINSITISGDYSDDVWDIDNVEEVKE